MAAGLAESDVRVVIEGDLVSRPYLDMTRRMVADFGGRVGVGCVTHVSLFSSSLRVESRLHCTE